MTKQNLWFSVFVVANIALLIVNGVWAWKNSSGKSDAEVAGRSDQYPLLSKRIFVENPNRVIINFVPVRKVLEEGFSNISVPYSVYFEYLPTGTSIGINQDAPLVAASLLKVPVVMDLYKLVEQGKINLDKEVDIEPEWVDKAAGILWEQGAGAKVTLRRAAELALTHSDNTAINVVYYSTLGLVRVDDSALAAADVDFQVDGSQTSFSAKSYSTILKCLYFSCYLTTEHSQEILEILTKTIFPIRIAQPIPKEIPVAHKIGVYQESQSDCGIVYLPKRQYLLCIMVDLPQDQANSLIAETSAVIYGAMGKLEL